MRRIFEEKTKTVPISKEQVWKAYKNVRANRGSGGVDEIDFTIYDINLVNNLYKLWNRLASGSYFPQAVKEVAIPKGEGKERMLGVPTLDDRIAQQVVKDYLEPRFENIFDCSSYGYRPNIGAHEALHEVLVNTRKYYWVLDLDISKFFDTVNHQKLILALEKHVSEKWVMTYIKRWLESPRENAKGELTPTNGEGTPQGGVISPLLANLYLHYSFDFWLRKYHPGIPFVRYADDIVLHCKTYKQCEFYLGIIRRRLRDCNLELHPDKTKIVFCKQSRRKTTQSGAEVKFDFLGFTFKPKITLNKKTGERFLGYGVIVSRKSCSRMLDQFKKSKFHRRSKDGDLLMLAQSWNLKIRGWIQYYDGFQHRSLITVFHHFHRKIVKWLVNRFKRFKGSIKRAYAYLRKLRNRFPTLFYHWEIGYGLV